MSTNQELARRFEEMAAALELTGANPFRVNAHTKVARLLEEMSDDIAALAKDGGIKRLTAIDGIGEGSAKKIVEYLDTGRIEEHETLLNEVPRGLFDVLNIPGLGPKTVKLMWEKADITDLESLKKALASGELEDLPRMGRKTIENIKDALEFAVKAGERRRLGDALPVAEAIIEVLREIKGVKQLEYAGSLRRGKETIGDIDILASTSDPEALSEAFRGMKGVTKVLAAGETKSSVRLDIGMQIDLRIVDDAAFGAALMYFTGSKEHNVILRERAIRMDMRLNEYGLFPDDDDETPPQQRGVKPVAARTEKAIYRKLKLAWIPPEMREDRGEVSAAEKDQLPKLIELDDIKAELHSHTTASDGKFSIDELAAEAKQRGYHTIAITDHSKSSVQANGLSPDRLREHIDAIREVDDRIKGITILAGSEVDIHADGSLDYDDDLLAELDVVVASPHASLKQEPQKATARLLAAIKHPLVHILGHPTGRLINAREGLSPDIHALIEAAVEHDTALELNANYLRLDLRDSHLKAAVEGGSLIAINTDAHSSVHFDYLRYGILTARRGWLTKSCCINTWGKTKLRNWLASKR
ncbi:MAG: DNA polymerase/3'-5' exonuclease PolX [Phycisphaerales bacterium]|nr:MAG: DNA polymerase/3'-5' exonuclease PolX [Phycisphaerales bacterium]